MQKKSSELEKYQLLQLLINGLTADSIPQNLLTFTQELTDTANYYTN